MENKAIKSKTRYISITVGLICVVMGLFLSRDILVQQAYRLKIIPQPESFTELYYTDVSKLFGSSSSARHIAPFTIHNHEHRRVAYRYVVEARNIANGQKQHLSEGVVELDNEQKQVIYPSTPSLMRGRVSVTVSLRFESMPLGEDKPRLEQQAIHQNVRNL